MKISEIMTKKAITVKKDTPVDKIAELLFGKGLTGVPVCENEKVIGIVTEADLVMQDARFHMPTYIQLLDSFVYFESQKHIEEELHKMLGTTALDVMTKKVISISPDATIEDLADLIVKNHINPIPVCKNNKLVGIVSRADLVKLLIKRKK